MKTLTISGIGRLVGEEAKIVSPAKRRFRHEAKGLAGVDTFQKRDFLCPRDDAIGNPVQNVPPRRAIHVAPCRKGVRGGLGRVVDVGGIATRDGRDRGHVDRRHAFQCGSGPRRAITPTDMIENRPVTKAGQEWFGLLKIICKRHDRSAYRDTPDVEFCLQS